MQLPQQLQIQLNEEENHTLSYSRLVDEIEKEEEKQKNDNQNKQASITQKETKQKEQIQADQSSRIIDKKEQQLQCPDGARIKVFYLSEIQYKSQVNNPPNRRPVDNGQNNLGCKGVVSSDIVKKNNSNKLISNSTLKPILQNDSENKKSDDQVNSQPYFLQSKICKSYKVSSISEPTNYNKETFGNTKQSHVSNAKEQLVKIQLNNSVYINNIQDSIQLLPDELDLVANIISKEEAQKSSRLKSDQDKRILSSLTTASKLFPRPAQQKNDQQIILNDPFLVALDRISKLQAEVGTMKEMKKNKSSKSVVASQMNSCPNRPVNNSDNPILIKRRTSDTSIKSFSLRKQKSTHSSQHLQKNFMDEFESLIRIAKQPVWNELIASYKNKIRLQNCLRKIISMLNLNQGFQIFSMEPLTIIFKNNQMLYLSYSQKIYVGECNKKGGIFVKEGLGLEIDPFNSIYRGSFSNGLKNGQCKFVALGKYKYEGQWKYGIMQGKGKLWEDKGNMYIGNFVNGKKQGIGKEQLFNGDKYEGQYKNNLFHGKGFYIWQSGTIYEGDFLLNKMHGKGKWISYKGDVYEGNFVNGQKNGEGINYNTNDRYQQGHFSRARLLSNNRRSSLEKRIDIRQRQSPVKYIIQLHK